MLRAQKTGAGSPWLRGPDDEEDGLRQDRGRAECASWDGLSAPACARSPRAGSGHRPAQRLPGPPCGSEPGLRAGPQPS